MATAIRWMNHAGHVLEGDRSALVADPWVRGMAFDGAWDLVAPSAFDADGWRRATHLWFSSDQPDRFHPPSLGDIPPTIARRLHVVFQETGDGRVAEWCRDRFGRVTELPATRWFPIDLEVDVRIVPHDNGTSWLAARTPSGTVLNLNDCAIESPAECRRVLDLVGPPAVLISHGSYANWVANPGDRATMEQASERRLDRLLTQIEILEPTVTIPVAGLTWFVHEDNHHLNEGRFDVVAVADRLRARGTAVQVLYPGDRWEVGDPDDALSARALARYQADLDARRREHPRLGEQVDLDEVVKAGEEWVGRLAERNGRAVALLPPARIHVFDHDAVYRLSAQGFAPAADPPSTCDLRVRSDALMTAFASPEGARNLGIGGRFSVGPDGRYDRFRAYATLAAFNVRGEGWSEIAATAAGRLGRWGRDRAERLGSMGAAIRRR